MILLWAWACAAHQDPSSLYLQDHRDWTRELTLTHNFELDLILRATLIDPDLARAQAAYLSQTRLEGPTEAAERLERALSESESSFVLVFSSYSPREDAKDFALDDSAAWQLRLLVGDQPAEPVSVERLDHPDVQTLSLYPQHNRWSELWVARFARSEASGPLTLQVGGVYGQGELRWGP